MDSTCLTWLRMAEVDKMTDEFTGNLTRLTLTIDRPKLTPEDEKTLKEAQRNNRVSEWPHRNLAGGDSGELRRPFTFVRIGCWHVEIVQVRSNASGWD